MNSSSHVFAPKLFTVLKEGYQLKHFGHDLLAGIVVGIVAVPLAIAFGIASGVTPQQGLVTAVVAGFLISALGGSRYQIGGPTGAFIVIIYDVVQKYQWEGLAVATIMAGVFLIVLGFARLGDVIKYIPYPVTVGFTAGIAVVIFTSQIKEAFGFQHLEVPDAFLSKWGVYLQHIPDANLFAIGNVILTIVILLLWPRWVKRVPAPLVAIVVTTLLAYFFKWPVETIHSRFGEIPHHFPAPQIPAFSWGMLAELSSPALAIALLAGIESLLSAVVADGMTGRRHRSNTELIAQGVANVVTPLFGGIPATGAIARTATNIKNGAHSPVSGIIHALTVLLIFLFFGKWAAYIPLSTLAGILVLVAYNMSEWHLFIKVLKSSKSDTLVLGVTFLLTVLVDLTAAIEVGLILACFLFMKRMIDVTSIKSLRLSSEDIQEENVLEGVDIPPDVEIFEIQGPFFFGAASKFKDTFSQIERHPKVLILNMGQVPTMDATALRALEEVLDQVSRRKTHVIICGLKGKLRKKLEDVGLVETIGDDHIVDDLKTALERSKSWTH